MAAGQSPKVPVLPDSGGPAAPLSVAAIPSFSPLAIQLLGIVSQENVGLHELAGLVRADPGISVEVLRLANSPLFGARSEITGILHAVAMLGLKRIKSMVMTVAIRDLLSPVRQAEIFAPCWRHSLATAFVCEQLAAEGSQDPDDSYTAGLLHELGQLGLIAARPAEYDRLVHRSRRGRPGPARTGARLLRPGPPRNGAAARGRLEAAPRVPRLYQMPRRHVPPRSAGGNRRAGWRICSASGWPARRRNSTAHGFPVSRPAL